MLITKRFDYIPFELVHKHPMIENHRPVNPQKVAHYQDDILKNGLLEPLVVWERNPRELFLVGGFHRHAAIEGIRRSNPGYFDRVDVRVVAGDLEEIRALNLKLNADRLDARAVEYFDTVIYLNNANWDKDRIASFLDKSVSWIEDILRFVPSMDARIRELLQNDKISWTKAKAICRRILDAEPGQERATADAALRELEDTKGAPPRRKLSVKSARRRFAKVVAKNPKTSYTVRGEDLLSLLTVLSGADGSDTEDHLARVRACFPGLVESDDDAKKQPSRTASRSTGASNTNGQATEQEATM